MDFAAEHQEKFSRRCINPPTSAQILIDVSYETARFILTGCSLLHDVSAETSSTGSAFAKIG
jgi:hypothetical protein